MNITEYKQQFDAAAEEILAFMEKEWGFRPAITVHCAQALLVTTSYARQGEKNVHSRRFWVDAGRFNTTRSPRAIAREVAAGIERRRRPRTPSRYKDVVETPEQFTAALRKELDALGVACGFTVEPAVHLKMDFNLKGFAHKGQGTYATEAQARTRKKPAIIARKFLSELCDHRQQCDRCGEGLPNIHHRAYGWRHNPGDLTDTPPDPVEKLLHPRLSDLITKRIAGEQVVHPAQRRRQRRVVQGAVS